MTAWAAFVRGVNVGGKQLSMPAFRESVASLGYEDVATHIQSGNVVFVTDDDEAAIARRIEAVLREGHDLAVPVVVRSSADLSGVVDRHPFAADGMEPKMLHVAFLDRAPGHRDDPAPDAWFPDRWAVEGRELFLAYPNGSARSKMTIDRFERAWAVTATARNLNTVRKVADLAAARDRGQA